MTITEVRIQHEDQPSKVVAYATILIDGALVIRDLRVIQRGDGRRYLAMPSRPIKDRCRCCRRVIARIDRYCRHCGVCRDAEALKAFAAREAGEAHVYADVCHPVTRDGRKAIETAVFAALDAVEHEQAATNVVA